ncbi:hypothetical protein HY468_00275, partial [Candidatus Roizmanbacteria bacterium]|nr:hypothetical protein [Candidatus Roizmanbacteria bacterium]
ETFGEHLSCSGTMDVSQVEIVLENKKIAVLLDVSASQKNFAVAPGLDDIQLLQASQLPLHNVIDVYKFNDRLSEKTTIKNGTESQLIKPVYFGKSDVVKALRLLPDMYDAVIVVTGQEQFEVGNAGAMQSHNFPVYIVHTGDTIPAYSRLFTNYILQSGGGTARSFFEAFDQFAAAQQEGQLTSSSYWSIQGNVEEPGDITKVVFTNNVDPLGVLAARGYVYKAIDENEGDIDEQLGILDGLHTFARANHILTPYSSMLSLVNQAQLLRLEEESKRYDRFEEGPMPVTLPSQPIFDMIEPPMLRQESLDLPMFGSPARQKLMGPSEGVSVPEGASFYGGGVGALTGFGGSLPILFILINVVFLGGGVLVFGMKALRARMRKQ